MTEVIKIDDEIVKATPAMIAELEATRKEIKENDSIRNAARAEIEAKKQEVLAKLGLTADEVAALLA